jgi:hypothetical protein
MYIGPFYLDLFNAIGVEQKSSNDVGKIRACVDLYLLLLQVEDPIRTNALKVISFAVLLYCVISY